MLDERKQRILRAIVDDYISTAEPIGSRTIAKKYSLGISPATIRNEMADLETLGYIKHLHTSSGRIPSSKGYRFYVDDLLTLEQMSENEISLINNWYATKVRSVEEIFRETSRIISQLTKNVSLVLAPQLTQTAFQYLRFLPLNEHQVIAVIMTDAGFIDNKIIDIPSGVSFKDFDNIASIFNHYLKGKRLSDISMASIRKIRGETVNSTVFNAIINIIDEALVKDKQERLYLGGARELMEQPEFHNIDKVKKLLSMFEEKQLLYDILHAQKDESLAVTIGQENKYNDIKDCSIISATYHLDGKPIATLAVLGPTRMDYGKIISLLKFMNANLADSFPAEHASEGDGRPYAAAGRGRRTGWRSRRLPVSAGLRHSFFTQECTAATENLHLKDV